MGQMEKDAGKGGAGPRGGPAYLRTCLSGEGACVAGMGQRGGWDSGVDLEAAYFSTCFNRCKATWDVQGRKEGERRGGGPEGGRERKDDFKPAYFWICLSGKKWVMRTTMEGRADNRSSKLGGLGLRMIA